ncbi:chitin synthase-domain-containing protein [Neurospora tetraspora]|uniref:chitin synthase n=1 Tax=Neurospora tetraspora TaxID=94610 RepID=A0AAE0J7M8_9PEZI|nr:chitin synthase-domain-containing protein [Neurospora tetraspora]
MTINYLGEDEWPVEEIVYTAIVGLVMLAACLEWFLWIAAFMYCLWKVFVKAEHWTVRVLSVIIGIAFMLLRCIFLPIMIVTLPLPSQVVKVWPTAMVSFLQWFAFYSFAGLLTIPWLFCVYQIVTHQLGRTKRIKQVLDEVSAPKVVIVMPCYKEDPEVLVTAIDSVVDCDYPPSCIHVFLSFDGDQEDELYLNTIEKLGVPLTLESYPKSIDVAYKNARITVSRFPHGGKRHCQKMTFKLIDRVYREYLKRNDNLFILFIDSDCILDKVCLQNFVYDMELSPGNRRDMLAMTGVITSTTQKHSLITLLQDMEYIHGQLFERTVESGCGAVTCLPGALTMLRFSAFRRMAKYYFADKAENCEDLFDYAKSHLGEDRWLTHLFMIGAKKRHQIQMCTSAFCKTEAVQTMGSLIKQRRRWFLGFITNEVCMLTDWRLWKRYPILILVRFMQNTIRTTALLFFIMVLALITTTKKIDDLPVGFIAISLGLNWLMMIYFGAKLRRFKIWLYPMMFVLNPFFNWYYMIYGIFTAGQRTWGGPRADAAAADSTTTAQEAIEIAEKTGDDLNIVPESFIPAAQERKGIFAGSAEDKGFTTGTSTGGLGRSKSILQPPDKLVGKFAAPERSANGLYQHFDDSMASVSLFAHAGGSSLMLPTVAGSATTSKRHHQQYQHQYQHQHQLQYRDSFDSTFSAHTTGGNSMSVYMPRRVESIMGEEDRRKYELAQASSGHLVGNPTRVLGQQQQPPPGQVYEFSESELRRAGFYTDSAPEYGRPALPSPSPPHRRLASSDSFDSVGRPAASPTPYQDYGYGQEGYGQRQQGGGSLSVPMPPTPSGTGHQQQRTGRSPLGRASWVRTSTMDQVESEIEASHGGTGGFSDAPGHGRRGG